MKLVDQTLHEVMMIDDDDDDRMFFLEVVHGHYPGIRCTIAENGRSAMNKLVVDQVRPQLIFLDLNMPVMNGWEFLAEIKKHNQLAEIPVVVLSTSSDPRTVSETRALGARDFFTKPDKLKQWKSMLQHIFNQNQ